MDISLNISNKKPFADIYKGLMCPEQDSNLHIRKYTSP